MKRTSKLLSGSVLALVVDHVGLEPSVCVQRSGRVRGLYRRYISLLRINFSQYRPNNRLSPGTEAEDQQAAPSGDEHLRLLTLIALAAPAAPAKGLSKKAVGRPTRSQTTRDRSAS
jgi:hypothetical protein